MKNMSKSFFPRKYITSLIMGIIIISECKDGKSILVVLKRIFLLLDDFHLCSLD